MRAPRMPEQTIRTLSVFHTRTFRIEVIALFQETFGRRPLAKDASEFSSVLNGALEKNGLPVDFLGESAEAATAVCATAAAEISPVCAILGGILGQEVGDGA